MRKIHRFKNTKPVFVFSECGVGFELISPFHIRSSSQLVVSMVCLKFSLLPQEPKRDKSAVLGSNCFTTFIFALEPAQVCA